MFLLYTTTAFPLEIGFFTLYHFWLPRADTSSSVTFRPERQRLTDLSPTPWQTAHSGLSYTGEPPRSGRSSVSAPSPGRSSAGLPSARWSPRKTSVPAGAGSAGDWEGLAEEGSEAAEEASGWAGCPGSGLEAGGWCWQPGRQGFGSQGQTYPHSAAH